MKLDKFFKCKKMIYSLLGLDLLCCCGVLMALEFEIDFQTICLLAKVLWPLLMVTSAICIVLSISLVRHARCPNCGKSVLKGFTEYKRMRQMKNGGTIECPYCKSIIV